MEITDFNYKTFKGKIIRVSTFIGDGYVFVDKVTIAENLSARTFKMEGRFIVLSSSKVKYMTYSKEAEFRESFDFYDEESVRKHIKACEKNIEDKFFIGKKD